MDVKIEIDSHSGFCNGVVRAIQQAENYLKFSPKLYSLGDIVHNSLELDRLKEKGLEILSLDEVAQLKDDVVLFRAHGEPPSTYATARANNIQIIDCTCPVVLKLQERVREVYSRMSVEGGQVVIFGKSGHAEVNGLVGQTDGNAVVIGSADELDKVDFSRPVALFSQTTKDPEEYAGIADIIRARGGRVEVYDTICRQVAQRHKLLAGFAASHSVILFVSGKESSNGKVLFDLCCSINKRSHWLENESQIDPAWFRDGDSIGICGATSTPMWQLEETLTKLSSILK
jgi:(E)-4-hydroxy-3-methyl-but-2-enyl pyrophosphate reductase (IPP and DMAPP forming)